MLIPKPITKEENDHLGDSQPKLHANNTWKVFKICQTLEQLTRISGGGLGHQYCYGAPPKILINSEGLERLL